MRTYTATPVDIKNHWYLIDAEGLVLGRLASMIAFRIRGKHKPMYTPHMDCGDHIVVINAKGVHMTAGKLDKKLHYWHTGYPGGIKSKTYNEILSGDNPETLSYESNECRDLKYTTTSLTSRERPSASRCGSGDAGLLHEEAINIIDIHKNKFLINFSIKSPNK